MKHIHPLIIILLLVILSAFFALKLHQASGELNEVKESYHRSMELAKELEGIKKSFLSQKKAKEQIERFLRSALLKEFDVISTFTHGGVKIEAKNIDAKALQFLATNLLNGSYELSEFKIKRLLDTRAHLQAEIVW